MTQGCPTNVGGVWKIQLISTGTFVFNSVTYQWRKDGQDIRDATSSRYVVSLDAMDRYGIYSCAVQNQIGTSTCTFRVTMAPYPVEFYYTPNDGQTKTTLDRGTGDSNFTYTLKWTQKLPLAAALVISYK